MTNEEIDARIAEVKALRAKAYEAYSKIVSSAVSSAQFDGMMYTQKNAKELRIEYERMDEEIENLERLKEGKGKTKVGRFITDV